MTYMALNLIAIQFEQYARVEEIYTSTRPLYGWFLIQKIGQTNDANRQPIIRVPF